MITAFNFIDSHSYKFAEHFNFVQSTAIPARSGSTHFISGMSLVESIHYVCLFGTPVTRAAISIILYNSARYIP